MEFNNKVSVTKNNVHIEDSYQITRRREMRELLEYLKETNPDSDVWNRRIFHMTCEWKAHNRMYRLGLFKSHTKDVDLNYPQEWYIKVLYFILGI